MRGSIPPQQGKRISCRYSGFFQFHNRRHFSRPLASEMTRRRKPNAPAASPAPPAGPPAQELASQLEGLALGSANQPQPPSVEKGAAAAALGGASSAAKGDASSGVGTSSSVPSSSTASLSDVAPPGGSHDVSAPPAPAEEKKACACCLVVIAGKVFFCSRCHLVTYCGKECQARTCPVFLARARV